MLSEKLPYSISTISKALNDSEEISVEAKRVIVETAGNMGYRSALGSVVVDKTVAVILPDVRNDFFAQALHGIQEEASANHYNVITCITRESHDKEVAHIRSLAKKGIDGFIVAVSEETQTQRNYDHFNDLIVNDVPLVMFDRVVEEVDCDKITIDDIKSGEKAVNALIQSGDRNIGMVSTISNLSVGQLREEGIRRRLSHFSDAMLHVIRATDQVKFTQSIADLFAKEQVQSIIALDQIAGILTLNFARSQGIKVPEDLQIICYSNGLLSQHSYPPMTVIDQHAADLGKSTFNHLFNMLSSDAKVKMTSAHTLQSSLLKRGTTRN